MNSITIPRPCPISLALNQNILDFKPANTYIRAVRIFLAVTKIIPTFCSSAPKILLSDPGNVKAIISLHNLNLPQDSFEKILVDIACQMHIELNASQTDYSALSRFGHLFSNFKDVFRVLKPNQEIEVDLNVIDKNNIN